MDLPRLVQNAEEGGCTSEDGTSTIPVVHHKHITRVLLCRDLRAGMGGDAIRASLDSDVSLFPRTLRSP